jgi:hypothetical protein
MLRSSIFAVLALTATVSFAGQQEANQCAAGLSPESKTIYDASAPKLSGSSDLRTVVTDTTRSLVMSGKVGRSTAVDSAEAAGKCLAML